MRQLKLLAVSIALLAAVAVGYVVFFVGVEAALRWYFAVTNFTASKVPNFAHNLRLGAEITIKLTVISSAVGLFLGLVAGVARLSKNPVVRLPAQFYIWVIRGTPLLVQILFAYNALPFLLEPVWKYLQPFGVPSIQDVLTPYWAAFIALSVNVGAYNAEVIRAGIQAIPKGQWEAAMSLGMRPYQVMRFIVVPQALKIVVPPLVNNVIALLKDSSLASVITLLELVHQGQRMISITFRPVEVYVAVAAIYLLLTTVLTFFTDWLEREMGRRGATA